MTSTLAKRSLFLLVAFGLTALSACVPQPRQPATPAPVPVSNSAPVVETPKPPVSIGEIPPNTPVIKVALLVPLTGESSAIGNAMLDAATVALYDNYLSVPSDQIHSQVVLLPKDSGATPADAARVTKQAIEQGAKFIVGPLFSQSVKAIAPIATAQHIGILSFSNNKSVASNGVYVFGFLPEQQVARVADYAFLHNMTRVALLAPNDPYGQKVQETLVSVYQQKGGTVAPTELYAPSPANIDAAVSRLAAYNNANSDRRFQAIFIGDSGSQLKNIIASLKKSSIDLSKVKLLGTGLWDDPEIAKIPEMNGAWFSSSPPENYQHFEQRFTTMYGYKPVRLASLSYDAVTIIAALTMSSPQADISDISLTSPQGFQTPANGLVRLKADGTSDRRLAIMEITPSGAKVIDVAPKTFDRDVRLAPVPQP